jgi:hypothetical protein
MATIARRGSSMNKGCTPKFRNSATTASRTAPQAKERAGSCKAVLIQDDMFLLLFSIDLSGKLLYFVNDDHASSFFVVSFVERSND